MASWQIRSIVVALALLAFGFFAPADAQQKKDVKNVAVLDLQNRCGLSPDEIEYLTDAVLRGGVRKALPPERFLLMTKETMITLLEEQGSQLEQVCEEESCVLDVGRKIQAHYLVVGSCFKLQSGLHLAVKLYDTKVGNLLDQEEASGQNVERLSKDLEGAVNRMLTKWLVTKPTPSAQAGSGQMAGRVGAPQALEASTEGMVLIPGGTFSMGCVPGDVDCKDDEKPRHQVTLRSFWLDTHEVTQADYVRVMKNNPSMFQNCDKCPVEGVTWEDARAYCAKLGKRLPTEAEWEYAARGGKDGEVVYGTLDEIAWYAKNSSFKTHPVGELGPNDYGLYDMLGNVWEWCWDWYKEDYYANSPSEDPPGPKSGKGHVMRGGSWVNLAKVLRASNRHMIKPLLGYVPIVTVNSSLNVHVGFRCARDE